MTSLIASLGQRHSFYPETWVFVSTGQLLALGSPFYSIRWSDLDEIRANMVKECTEKYNDEQKIAVQRTSVAVWWAQLRGKLLYVCIMHKCLWLFLLFMSACMSEYVHVVVLQHRSLEGSSLRCETQLSLSPRSKSNVKHDKRRWKTPRGTTTSALLHISVINVIVHIPHLILLCYYAMGCMPVCESK